MENIPQEQVPEAQEMLKVSFVQKHLYLIIFFIVAVLAGVGLIFVIQKTDVPEKAEFVIQKEDHNVKTVYGDGYKLVSDTKDASGDEVSIWVERRYKDLGIESFPGHPKLDVATVSMDGVLAEVYSKKISQGGNVIMYYMADIPYKETEILLSDSVDFESPATTFNEWVSLVKGVKILDYPVSEWNLYSDKGLGLEIRYPTHWNQFTSNVIGYELSFSNELAGERENDVVIFTDQEKYHGNILGGDFSMDNVAIVPLANSENCNGDINDEWRVRDTSELGGGIEYTKQFRVESLCISAHASAGEDKGIVDKILSTFKFLDSENDSQLYPDGKPIIQNISSSSGSVGTELTIKGEELAGFEGELYVIFEREDGKTIRIRDKNLNYSKDQGKTIEVTIDEPCEEGETIYIQGSGNPTQCPYVEFTPGTYKVYVEPWGKRSNEVIFTVTN